MLISQLIRLFYVSRCTEIGANTLITDILAVARTANAKNDITGLLTFDGERFTQVLEGPAENVQKLMLRINEDSRHHEVRVLLTEPILKRDFPEWSMGYVYDAEMSEEVESFFSIVRPQLEDVEFFIEEQRLYHLSLH